VGLCGHKVFTGGFFERVHVYVVIFTNILFQDLNVVMFFCVVPGAREFVLRVLHICAAVYPSVPHYQYAAL